MGRIRVIRVIKAMRCIKIIRMKRNIRVIKGIRCVGICIQVSGYLYRIFAEVVRKFEHRLTELAQLLTPPLSLSLSLNCFPKLFLDGIFGLLCV